MYTRYVLTIKFVGGEQKEFTLTEPHKLSPDNMRPVALTYKDANDLLHNIPFSSMLDFWFSVEDYKKCEAAQVVKKTTGG